MNYICDACIHNFDDAEHGVIVVMEIDPDGMKHEMWFCGVRCIREWYS